MKGVQTPLGQPPDYCGPGVGEVILSHTIPRNVIEKASQSDKKVVAFSPRVALDRWSPNETKGPIFPETPIGVATVGRYACAWHDSLFSPIDSAPYDLQNDQPAPALIALRATLMEHFLLFRYSEFFKRRADYCLEKFREWPGGPQECDCRDLWWSYYREDRQNEKSASKRHVPALLEEAEKLVALVKRNDQSEIVAQSFFLPGLPAVGGTLVWISNFGDPMTLTIVPVSDGHHIYITHYANPANVIQRIVADLVSHRVPFSRKGQILSEIALQQNQAVFLLKRKWRSMTQQEQDAICAVAAEKEVSLPSANSLKGLCDRWKWRWRYGRAWRLKGDPRVPDLFL